MPECADCRFFKSREPISEDGYCKRRAPAPLSDAFHALCRVLVYKNIDGEDADDLGSIVGERFGPLISWPQVYGDDWCGEYERNPDAR